jgi:hypothetical protein
MIVKSHQRAEQQQSEDKKSKPFHRLIFIFVWTRMKNRYPQITQMWLRPQVSLPATLALCNLRSNGETSF